jgi:hypothetical protein
VSEFDPIKAAREELTGLMDVLTVMRRSENDAEQAMSQAENSLNAMRKIRGYCLMEVDRLRAHIASLEAARDAGS